MAATIHLRDATRAATEQISQLVIASVDAFPRYAETTEGLELQRGSPDPMVRMAPALERGPVIMPDGLPAKAPAQSKVEKW